MDIMTQTSQELIEDSITVFKEHLVQLHSDIDALEFKLTAKEDKVTRIKASLGDYEDSLKALKKVY